MRLLPDEKNPFTEPITMKMRLGSCQVYLKSLAYLLPVEHQLEITDLRGTEVGLLDVAIAPCDSKGKELSEGSGVG